MLVRAGCLLLALSCGGAAALADGFTVTGKLGGNFEMDTNPLLLKKGQQTLIGWNSTPQLILTGRTPDLTVDSLTRVNDGRFNLNEFNSTDLFNFTTIKYQGEQYYLQLQSGFSYDTTRNSEVETSGINIAGIRHTGINLTPEFGYNINDVQQIVVDGSYLVSLYDDKKNRYTDYESFGLTPKYLYSFTLRDTGFVALQSSYFKALEGPKSTGASVGPMVGWTHHFSDRFTTSADVGFHVINNDTEQDGSTWDNDYFYDFSLTYGQPGDPDIASITVSRSLQPQSSAQQVTENTVALKETHHFTPRFAAIVSGTYHHKSYTLTDNGKQKDYLEGSAALQYNVTQELTAAASYRYRQQTTVGGGGIADSHTVLLTVTYSPNTTLFSW